MSDSETSSLPSIRNLERDIKNENMEQNEAIAHLQREINEGSDAGSSSLSSSSSIYLSSDEDSSSRESDSDPDTPPPRQQLSSSEPSPSPPPPPPLGPQPSPSPPPIGPQPSPPPGQQPPSPPPPGQKPLTRRPQPPPVPNEPPAQPEQRGIVFEKDIIYQGTTFFVSISGYHGLNEESNIPYIIKIYQDKTKKNLISAMYYEFNQKILNNSGLLTTLNGGIGEMKNSVYKILHTSIRYNSKMRNVPATYHVYSRLVTDIKTIIGNIEFRLPEELLHEKYLFQDKMVYPLCKDNENESLFYYSRLLTKVYIPEYIMPDVQERLISNYIVSLIMVIKEKYNNKKEKFEQTLKLLQENVYNKYFIAINVEVENLMTMIKKREIYQSKFTSLFDLINYKSIHYSIKSISKEDKFLQNTDEFICLLKDLINYEIEGGILIRLGFNSSNKNDNYSKKYYEKIEKQFYALMMKYINKDRIDTTELNVKRIEKKHKELTNVDPEAEEFTNIYTGNRALNIAT